MSRSLRFRPGVGRVLLAGLAWGVAVSCGDRPIAPGEGATALRILPVVRQGSDVPILDVDELRVRVFDESGDALLAEEIVPVAPTDVEVEVEVRIDATPGDPLTVEVALRRSGDDVYVGGPVSVVPSQTPVRVEVDYVGEGACLETVGTANIGPVGGSAGIVQGRLELGDCYLGGDVSFADRWELDVPRDAGLNLAVVPSGPAALRLRLQALDGTILADGDTDGFGLFIAAGTYVAVVTSAAPLEEASYELRVGEFDRCDEETGLLAPGVTSNQALTSIDCPLASGRAADLWGVDLSTDTPYRIDLESTAFDARLLLTDDDVLDPFLGEAYEEDDDGGLGTDALLAGVLPPGRYRVWATSFSSGEVGPYRISMQLLSTGAPTLEVRDVVALGVGGPGGACGSAQAFRFDFGFEDGDGDLQPPGGVTIRLTGIPGGRQEVKGLDWAGFPGINPYAGYAEILTCETFDPSDTGKLAEFFLTDAAGGSSAIFSTTLSPLSGSPPVGVVPTAGAWDAPMAEPAERPAGR